MPIAGTPTLRTNADMYHKIKRGLVAYWPLASAGAVDLEDYRGYHDLTNNNGVTRADGPSNNLPDAASFAGASSQYFSIANANAPQFDWGDLTIAFWANPGTPSSGERWFSKDGGGANRTLLMLINASTQPLRFLASVDGTNLTEVMPAVSDQTDTWGLYVVRYRASTGLLRADVWGENSDEATIAGGGNLFTSTANFVIGSQNGVSNFLTGLETAFLISDMWLPDALLDWYHNNGEGRDLLRAA